MYVPDVLCWDSQFATLPGVKTYWFFARREYSSNRVPNSLQSKQLQPDYVSSR